MATGNDEDTRCFRLNAVDSDGLVLLFIVLITLEKYGNQ